MLNKSGIGGINAGALNSVKLIFSCTFQMPLNFFGGNRYVFSFLFLVFLFSTIGIAYFLWGGEREGGGIVDIAGKKDVSVVPLIRECTILYLTGYMWPNDQSSNRFCK